MNFHDFIMQLLLLVITFVVPYITGMAANYIKAKTVGTKWQHGIDVAWQGVQAIEQTMQTAPSEDKKKAVEQYLSTRLKGVSADDIDKLIEAAVHGIKLTMATAPQVNVTTAGAEPPTTT